MLVGPLRSGKDVPLLPVLRATRFHRFGLWGRNVVLDGRRSHCTCCAPPHLIRGADSDTDEKVGTCLCRSRSMPPRRPADEIKPLCLRRDKLRNFVKAYGKC